MRAPVVIAGLVLIQLFLGGAVAGYAIVSDARGGGHPDRVSARTGEVHPNLTQQRRDASAGCRRMVRHRMPERSSLAFLREHVQVEVAGRTYVVGGTVELHRLGRPHRSHASHAYACTMTLPASGSWTGSVELA